jgi:hypothetical protein
MMEWRRINAPRRQDGESCPRRIPLVFRVVETAESARGGVNRTGSCASRRQFNTKHTEPAKLTKLSSSLTLAGGIGILVSFESLVCFVTTRDSPRGAAIPEWHDAEGYRSRP